MAGRTMAAAGVVQGGAQRHMRAWGGDTWGGAAPEPADDAAFVHWSSNKRFAPALCPDSDCRLWTPEAHRQWQTRHTVTTHGASAVT